MATIRKSEQNFTKDLSEVEKNLGVDLAVNKDGDLILNNLSDLTLLKGAQNAAQAVRLKLEIQPGGLVYHPAIGTDLQIGEKTKSAFAIRTQIIKSLSQDPRFENVDAIVTVLNNVILVDLKVSIVDTGIEVPLQFSVPN